MFCDSFEDRIEMFKLLSTGLFTDLWKHALTRNSKCRFQQSLQFGFSSYCTYFFRIKGYIKNALNGN